ncbi:bifunctional UDP-N-acetylglucosamine diphosphorylase/glucosamine-1-phosphate N-acetyltransferase GlmU [Marinobacter lutaoensis]|uniref:bifunctional UDP-N-acetylglucosamine diphosphorylase/glucosamine-1-phosphate N-acetyltransferase GlmU n=1 Tax=Marinobacter lutaoensis TaxID=135739 RepID=UPI001594571B|nr:bifunctional UDP-N-acetylglucosamine diphosphorylase/glucosamine-1-phosphate N-acetyltransferase GlmU [Marinobacter lutaoensis]NVD36335.1 bifunctional UDP-N-acetylglucosamine diphosphorylase/glucosamine-1-phosphate N-acetyltransferase GlmU [Marinobacter lutaoensis]
MSPLHVVILAAGQGSRMKSSLPKVLHPVAGKPMLHHVIETAMALDAEQIHVVIGHAGDRVREASDTYPVNWVEQSEQLGTGHAVAQVLPHLPDQARVLILYGDVPLTRTQTLHQLTDTLDERQLGLLTVTLDDPNGYGRIVRNREGRVVAIVEHKDATEAQRAIREVNTGILAVLARHLKAWLPSLSNRNAQGEYYLTDIIGLAAAQGITIRVAQPATVTEVEGVNNRVQLAALERAWQRQQAERLMLAGVTLADPERLDVRGQVTVGQDVFIDANVLLEGDVVLEEGVRVGFGCVIRDSRIARGTEIHPYSVIESSVIGENAQIGPFARFRPGNTLAANTKVGNFVEIKKSVVGAGSKINHLSYVGDARLGERVNVGAGTITCNYDGANKHATVIGDGAFIGSNTSLVAPVTVGSDATIGAGSTITRDVADTELAVARGKQRNIAGWERPKKPE